MINDTLGADDEMVQIYVALWNVDVAFLMARRIDAWSVHSIINRPILLTFLALQSYLETSRCQRGM